MSYAVERKQWDMVEMLLKHGADANMTLPVLLSLFCVLRVAVLDVPWPNVS